MYFIDNECFNWYMYFIDIECFNWYMYFIDLIWLLQRNKKQFHILPDIQWGIVK